MLIVIRRARQQTGYRPVFEDWLWHVVLPLVAYALVLIVASLLTSHSPRLLFLVALAALLLLFIGIHNAWDTITYFAISEPQALKESGDQEKDKTGVAG
jgi:L-asparagine transporter-like permease